MAAIAPIEPVTKVGRAYGNSLKNLTPPNNWLMGYCVVGFDRAPPGKALG